jgi:hypothetical protein
MHPFGCCKNGEGVLFRQTQTDYAGSYLPVKTLETPTFTPTFLMG